MKYHENVPMKSSVPKKFGWILNRNRIALMLSMTQNIALIALIIQAIHAACLRVCVCVCAHDCSSM